LINHVKINAASTENGVKSVKGVTETLGKMTGGHRRDARYEIVQPTALLSSSSAIVSTLSSAGIVHYW